MHCTFLTSSFISEQFSVSFRPVLVEYRCSRLSFCNIFSTSLSKCIIFAAKLINPCVTINACENA